MPSDTQPRSPATPHPVPPLLGSGIGGSIAIIVIAILEGFHLTVSGSLAAAITTLCTLHYRRLSAALRAHLGVSMSLITDLLDAQLAILKSDFAKDLLTPDSAGEQPDCFQPDRNQPDRARRQDTPGHHCRGSDRSAG